ncbi:MAG: glycosyltransferase family 4 protein [Okeania sp. SIO3B5]|uniref:hypothetical protein n=1 Tax=Okeania sp. SIO3B5 TaxID=2607811 RepID=UPI0013FFF83B|nr:hypothetical protein [Okeania sp. SIO3B5]NEO57259.1 glycosyltransferase family 4 protein [Okeania sp. SIO3B5]
MNAKEDTKIIWVVEQISERNAGYTIRTKPITDALNNYGFSVKIIELSDFIANYQKLKPSYQMVVFSKLYNDLALLLAYDLKKSGKTLIFDLFDNYLTYSPTSLARGLQRRMATMVSLADGVIASSENMKEVVHRLGHQNVIHIGDPIQANSNNDGFLKKWSSLNDKLIFTWFGISGNPFYRAGLIDLIESVRRIANLFRQLEPIYQCKLVICTNDNPEIVKVLEVMRSHSIPTYFQLWEPDSFEVLMSETHCVLIPTNNSPFVIAKTHNRASTALMSGCLVLVDDHPEYNKLLPYVYQNWSIFASDILNLKGEQIIGKLKKAQEFLISAYSTEKFASQLATFLGNELVKSRENSNSNNSLDSNFLPVFLVGKNSGGPKIKLARMLNYLCVGSKLIRPTLNYDIEFGISNYGDFLEITFNKKGIKDCLPKIPSNYEILRKEAKLIKVVMRELSSDNQTKLMQVKKYQKLKESWVDYENKFYQYMFSLIIGFLRELGYSELFFNEEGVEDIIYPNFSDQELDIYERLKTVMV